MKGKKPHSKFARWILTKALSDMYLEEFFGDLDELYDQRLETKGAAYAKLMYWVDTAHLLIGFTSFKIFKTQNNNIIMIQNMFKMAIRSARKQKQFTILNLLGLSLGITACLFIGLYIHEESTFDRFHEKGYRIYRVNQPMIWNAWDEQFASTGPNVALALKEEAPEFEELTRLLSLGPQTLRMANGADDYSLVKETKFFGAEENFFNLFSFKAIQGDLSNALKEPLSIVITEETALRYFGYEEAVGKFIEVKEFNDEWRSYMVKAVIEDIPTKSHLQFDILVSFSSYPDMFKDSEWKWIWTGFSTYGLVQEGTDIEALTEKIQAVPPKYAPATTTRIFNQSYEEFTNGNPWTLYLQPLNEIYLSNAPDSHRFGPTGKPQPIKIFTAVGVLILILSSINFMNLSTARSGHRAKEIGVKKVLGSHKRSLIYQFIFESVLFVFASTIVAFFTVWLTTDSFNELSNKSLDISQLLIDPVFIALTIAFVLLLGILAGAYPAFYLSSFRPIEALKGGFSGVFKGKNLRNGLVIFQFTISIALVICTFFVQRQLNYASSLNLGFDRDNVLQVHNMEQLGDQLSVLKSKLSTNPAIEAIGTSYATPANVWDGERYKTKGPDPSMADMSNFRTEGEYLDLLGVEFIAGRNFDPARVNDKYSVILNEKAVKALGWGTPDTWDENSPIGKMVVCAFDNEEELELIGIVKDFNYNTLKKDIEPLVIMHQKNDRIWNYGLGRAFISLRLNPELITSSENLSSLLSEVEDEVHNVDTETMFEYSFMDQDFEATFKEEERMGKVLNLFSMMMMVVACLGLFGLAAFSAEQRLKELCIRKVLGAKVTNLVITFSSEFTVLVGISVLVAIPVSYFLVSSWLNEFAFHTPVQAWVFVVATVLTMLLAVLTIGYQSFANTRKNPAIVLKNS